VPEPQLSRPETSHSTVSAKLRRIVPTTPNENNLCYAWQITPPPILPQHKNTANDHSKQQRPISVGTVVPRRASNVQWPVQRPIHTASSARPAETNLPRLIRSRTIVNKPAAHKTQLAAIPTIQSSLQYRRGRLKICIKIPCYGDIFN